MAKELTKEHLPDHNCQLIARLTLSIDDPFPDTYTLSHQSRVRKRDFQIVTCQSHPSGICLDVTFRSYSQPLPVKLFSTTTTDKRFDLRNKEFRVFTLKDIQLFLSKTNDQNPVHYCDHPIVPGMLIMTSLPICAQQIDMRFITPLYSDERFWITNDLIHHTIHGYTTNRTIFTASYIPTP